MKKIIIDTNAWMAIADFKIDLFEELKKTCDFLYRIAVFQSIIDELKRIVSEQGGKFRQAALLALGIIEVKDVEVINKLGNVDDLLVKHSRKGDLVLTQDVVLKKRLKKPYLTIRQKKKIIIVG